ncbi:MAG: hypothetical protein A3J07_02095 [Candidatus Doudnabacteria bacterium RIFCSPLOWO2_02_FULL_49_13]|uniref:Uncharacterized protein n=1 Tax=Candidatus Doudnabacteria bacterium RIFCSPHIGHO2_12_FULL_48_16 TaxID=1817838 RepID=A0A1F5PL95_9BACT|nr:MAG: hypothetical protein A3B77_00615 [Candidatus Doudnabacteria bacterium RIFCSPHIGHO2_02_FULL_49_24]OGE89675.1 MAG: hypothetical protein A2760_00725 [Candidatus Doudnabacteria bacterium RIFCSPHIGHO2_01_FULL_50_67]OGE90725.1 MAG: hypothetical protein A3E29_01195 [Candidatus Doudnabacteria bacterium RIFCSPHIGHO2_12_FULL_48_16]OGF02588.1 MAG: hypothetical protein A3J07_02095 [Candidatus Doudnabacteria bacterium RIFCSPLOWO2_02_FULL_49_13]
MKMIFRKIAIGLVLISLVGGQFFVIKPKPAEALFGVGDFTFNTEVANWYDVFKDIGLAAAQRIAISYANKYLTRFVDKLIDKYRIKDYLAYDKVLSGYYLNKYIYDNVSDPDLRAIYGLLARDINNRATVTDSSGNSKPLMAALRQKIDKFYYERGGINSNRILNPNGAFVEDKYYFAAARAYFSSPPDFTQQELYGEFGRMVADSEKAAGSETANSQGLKNDRSTPTGIVPRICTNVQFSYPEIYSSDPSDPEAETFYYPKQPITNLSDCILAGGEWKVDSTGIAQSAIQNPSAFIHNFATNAIQTVFQDNFGLHDNLYSTIGSLLGSFIFNKLNLTKSGGTFNESGSGYQADNGVAPLIRDLDLDGDNIPEGQDVDGDNQLNTISDVCYHGGTAPNCKKSSEVKTSPYFTPICQSLDQAVAALAEFNDFILTHKDHIKPDGDNFVNKSDADIWARRAGLADSAIDNLLNNIQNYRSNYFDNMEIAISRYQHFLSKMSQSIQKDQDMDLSRLRGNGGGGLGALIQSNQDMLQYLKDTKAAIGRCDNPNVQAAGEVVPPDIIDPGDEGDEDGPTCVDEPDNIACKSADRTELVANVKRYVESKGIALNSYCGGFEIVKRVAWALRGEGAGLTVTYHTSQCNGFSADVFSYPDNSGVDILGSVSETNIPAWLPMPPSGDPGVHYSAPIDPGDPADACYLTNTPC